MHIFAMSYPLFIYYVFYNTLSLLMHSTEDDGSEPQYKRDTKSPEMK